MKNILIIEEDESVRTTLALMLRRDGHSVSEASNGSDGLSLLSVENLDLVFTDYIMAGMSGVDFAHQARRTHPDLPIVIMSGGNVKSVADEIGWTNVKKIIQKPFYMEEIRETITRFAKN